MRFIRESESALAPSGSTERKKAIQLFEKNSQLRFRRQDLLDLAFSHRSFSNEHSQFPVNNERLEFLGDSVLGLVVAEYLYRNFPEKTEGELAKIKSFVVSEESLSEIALGLGVPDCLLIGKGEELSGGRQKKAILADALEALIGACYIDQGIKEASRFVLECCIPEIEKVLANKHKKDYKTLLQEQVQKTLKSYPRYVMTSKSGPDHAKVFWMEVLVGSERFGPAEGSTKKEAEQKVAEIAFTKLFQP